MGTGRRIATRLVLMVGAPLLVLALIELALRVAGVGGSTDYFAPVEGAHASTINPRFLKTFTRNPSGIRFQPYLLPDAKPPGTVRVFVLGESAALGMPNPSFGFGRFLEVLLSDRFPDARFEVFNAAMWGVDSHVLRSIAEACAARKPDLFVVYMGNNEAVSLHAPSPDSGWSERSLAAIRALQGWRATRIGQWIAAHAPVAPPPAQDQPFFRARRFAPEDPRRRAVDANYEANLEAICDAAESAGARVVLSTVVVNLRDCPPLGSLHRADLGAEELARFDAAMAAGRFEEAAALDDQFADVDFRLGEAQLALGHVDEARRRFEQACDRDALPFRTNATLNGIVRAVAARRAARGVALVDAERLFETGPDGAPAIAGEESFTDHVHWTIEGSDRLARALFPAVATALEGKCGAPSNAPLPDRATSDARLAVTTWEEAQELGAMAQLVAAAPFQDQLDHARRQAAREKRLADLDARLTDEEMERALATYRTALSKRPDDWAMRFDFGRLCANRHDDGAAAQHFAYATRRFPDWLPGRLMLGATLMRAGRRSEAQAQFREALRIDPTSAAAKDALAKLEPPR